MKERIIGKIEEIERYLQELSEIIPNSYKEYISDFKTKAACERYAEKIIEASVDLAFLVINEEKFISPEEEIKSFDILEDENIISKELTNKLKHAKGMRNILAHEYGIIDDEIVFDSLSNELKEDIKEFIKDIRLNLK